MPRSLQIFLGEIVVDLSVAGKGTRFGPRAGASRVSGFANRRIE
jgi:hypothetical protein